MQRGRARGGLRYGWVPLHCVLAACGGKTDAVARTGAPEAETEAETASCAPTTDRALNLQGDLPGRWHSPFGEFMVVERDLRSVWGNTSDSGDQQHGSSIWSVTSEGLVKEVGQGPCFEGDACGARFVRTGSTAVDAEQLVFYALVPKSDCEQGVAEVYEGEERFEKSDGNQGEVRLWSEHSERLTLYVDGTWSWTWTVKNYGTVNDMGMGRWFEDPEITEAQDAGTYERGDGVLRFWTDVDDVLPGWIFFADAAEEPVELALIGSAIPRQGAEIYERVEP